MIGRFRIFDPPARTLKFTPQALRLRAWLLTIRTPLRGRLGRLVAPFRQLTGQQLTGKLITNLARQILQRHKRSSTTQAFVLSLRQVTN